MWSKQAQLRGGKKTKIHQKVVTLTSVWSPAWLKAAQNKTPSDGLIRVAKACRHLFFPNPTSILQIRGEQTGKPQCCKGKLRRWCARGWVRFCERKQLDKFTWPAIDKRVKSEKVAKTLQRKALSRVNKSWEIEANTTSKRVGGINSGSSCWLKISILEGAMDSSSSFLIASRQNDNNHHALAHALNKTCSGFHRCLLCLSSSFNVHQGTASSLIEQQQALSSGLS